MKPDIIRKDVTFLEKEEKRLNDCLEMHEKSAKLLKEDISAIRKIREQLLRQHGCEDKIGEALKEKTFYKVDRSFCEKLVALLNHSTNPIMNFLKADGKTKKRIVIDYDPQLPKVKFTYYEEDIR